MNCSPPSISPPLPPTHTHECTNTHTHSIQVPRHLPKQNTAKAPRQKEKATCQLFLINCIFLDSNLEILSLFKKASLVNFYLLRLLMYFNSFSLSYSVCGHCSEINSPMACPYFSASFWVCQEPEAQTTHYLGHLSGLRLHQEILQDEVMPPFGIQNGLTACQEMDFPQDSRRSSAETNSPHEQHASKPLGVTLRGAQGQRGTEAP